MQLYLIISYTHSPSYGLLICREYVPIWPFMVTTLLGPYSVGRFAESVELIED